MPTIAAVTALLSEFEEDPEMMGWRTKWTKTCDVLWKFLSENDDQSSAIPEKALDSFIKQLTGNAKFSIARLMIPELRENAKDVSSIPHHPQQQRILDETRHLRNSAARTESATQADFDDPLYIAEKRTLMEAEMQRARVLLHQSGAFGSESEDRIRDWLGLHPNIMYRERK